MPLSANVPCIHTEHLRTWRRAAVVTQTPLTMCIPARMRGGSRDGRFRNTALVFFGHISSVSPSGLFPDIDAWPADVAD
jgi:hypothetical protein